MIPGSSLSESPSLRRPSDSWSCTEVKTTKHSHIWTVKGYSQCECRYLETSVRPVTNDIVFRIRLHPQGNKDSNKDFTFFQVFCNKNDTKYRAKFTVLSSRNEEIATTVYAGQQQLHGYFEYIRRDLLLNHLLPTDELNLLCELNITCDTVTRCSYNIQKNARVQTREREVATDLGQLYRETKLSDFVIVCSERELAVHKSILSARSPVFAAMLEHDTAESQNGCVVLDDIDPEVSLRIDRDYVLTQGRVKLLGIEWDQVCNEMLTYIYSGKAPNLNEMAADVLAAADRFSLPGLKDMAEDVLRSNLTIDTACRSLVLASMYGSQSLKEDAIRHVAQHSTQVIKTDGWAKMVESQPGLVTEVVSAISDSQDGAGGSGRGPSSSTSTDRTDCFEPPFPKRSRRPPF